MKVCRKCKKVKEFLEAAYYTNLQSLWVKNNLQKGSKLLVKGGS